MADVSEIRDRVWQIDQKNYVPVTVIFAGNIYVGQVDPQDDNAADQVVLSMDGALALRDLLMELLP